MGWADQGQRRDPFRPDRGGRGGWADRREGRESMSEIDALLSGAADGASMGFGDEGLGAIRGALAALQGEDFGDAYENSVAESRDRQSRAAAEHGGYYLGGQLGGSLASFLIPGVGWGAMGARAARMLPGAEGAARFFMDPAAGWARRAIGGALSGGAFGALAGYGHGEGNPLEGDFDRLGNAAEGGVWGAGFGALAPLAGSAISGLSNVARGVSKSGRAGARAPVTGPYGPVETARPIGDELADTGSDAMDDFIRTMGRAGHDADSLGAYVDDALASDPGRGRTFVDAGAPAAVNRMKYLTKAPGETATRAERQFAERGQGALGRLEDDLGAGRDGARISTQELEDTVEQLYRTEGQRLYEPLFQQPVTPRGMDTFARQIAPLIDDPAFAKATAEGERMFATDQLLGLAPAGDDIIGAAGMLARKLHYTKLALDDMIRTTQRASDSSAMGANRLRQLTMIKQRLLDAMDDGSARSIVPGYTNARSQWGGIVDAEDAIAMGRAIFNPGQTPERIAQYVQRLTPWQRLFYRSAIDETIITRLASRDIEGTRNIANALLDSQKLRLMRAAFRSEDEFNAFRRALSTESFLAKTGQQASPRSGSDTGIALFEGIDQIANGARPRGPVEAAWNTVGGIADDIGGRVIETRNNELGRLLLQQIDDPETAPQIREFLKEIAKRLAERQKMTRDAAFGVWGGGQAGSSGVSNRSVQDL